MSLRTEWACIGCLALTTHGIDQRAPPQERLANGRVRQIAVLLTYDEARRG